MTMLQGIELLVLDVHGVVLNNPFRDFLSELARRTDQHAAHVLARWEHEVRVPAWTGKLSDRQIWRALAGRSATDWHRLLERYYRLGPLAPRLEQWKGRVPIWLLSNHRSHWLVPRLERFGLLSLVDRILVSDEMGFAKPSPEVFAPVLQAPASPEAVLYVDDQAKNTRIASRLGLQTALLPSNKAPQPAGGGGRTGIRTLAESATDLAAHPGRYDGPHEHDALESSGLPVQRGRDLAGRPGGPRGRREEGPGRLEGGGPAHMGEELQELPHRPGSRLRDGPRIPRPDHGDDLNGYACRGP